MAALMARPWGGGALARRWCYYGALCRSSASTTKRCATSEAEPTPRARHLDEENNDNAKWSTSSHERGALQHLPAIGVPDELLRSAQKKANKVRANRQKHTNAASLARARAVLQLETYRQALTTPITGYLRLFPKSLTQLHPFERKLVQLTLLESGRTYEAILADVLKFRRRVSSVGKGAAARVNKGLAEYKGVKGAMRALEEGEKELTAVYMNGCYALDELRVMSKTLRRLPVVDFDVPTVALAGAPNTGKSSIVRALSSGTPEVNAYPFTTKGVVMGHVFVDSKRHQVTDTPGILPRANDERNAMELLTFAALAHMPTAVVFVTDLTEECGCSLEEQAAVRKELRLRFPNKPWIDVASKADRVDAKAWCESDEEFGNFLRDLTHEVPLRASLHENPLGDDDDDDDDGEGEDEDEATLLTEDPSSELLEDAASVPKPIRVSAVTGDGVDTLLEAITEVLRDRRQHLF